MSADSAHVGSPRPGSPRSGSTRARHVSATARSMVTLGPARGDLAPALRIAVSLGVPLVVLLLSGRLDWALFVSFGAFTSIYARYVPTRVRLRQQGEVGALLVACVGLGALIAQLAPAWPTGLHPWVTALAGAVVAAVSSVVIAERGLRPTGAVFPVFATTAVATAPSAAPTWLAMLIAGGAVAWCLAMSALAHWMGEANPGGPVPAPVPGSGTRSFRLQELSRYGIAALVAGAIATLSGIPSPYWAQVAAVVPLSAPGRRQQIERGLHRIVGTAIGVGAAAFLLSFPSQAWQVIVWVVLMQFLAELFVLRNYSLALVFITPLALLMVFLAHPGPVGPLLVARIAESAIGAVVGIAVVLGAVVLEPVLRRRSDQS